MIEHDESDPYTAEYVLERTKRLARDLADMAVLIEDAIVTPRDEALSASTIEDWGRAIERAEQAIRGFRVTDAGVRIAVEDAAREIARRVRDDGEDVDDASQAVLEDLEPRAATLVAALVNEDVTPLLAACVDVLIRPPGPGRGKRGFPACFVELCTALTKTGLLGAVSRETLKTSGLRERRTRAKEKRGRMI